MNERRRSQRMEPRNRLRARMKNGEWGLVLDLSPHGAQIQTTIAMGPRSPCAIDLALEQGEVRLEGVVRRCRAAVCLPDAGVIYNAGLEFVRLDTDCQDLLEEALVELCLTEADATAGEQPGVSSPTARSSVG